MKVSLIKSKNDSNSIKMFKGLGFDVIELDDLEKTDIEIDKLVNEKYKTIILTNEVAGFSENIIKKYNKSDEINIIIAPSKRRE